MKCPKCNGSMIDGCCIKCGYLSSGNIIQDKTSEKYVDEKLFNKDFYKLYNNKGLGLIFIFGSLYFAYRGFLITSILAGILNIAVYYIYYNLVNYSIFTHAQVSALIVYFFLNRLVYMTLANSVCLLVDKLKIRIYKKIYKDNYKDKISKHKHNRYYLFVAIGIYAVAIYLFFKGYS